MKKNLLWLLLVLATAVQAALPDSATPSKLELKPVAQQAQAAHLAAELLTRFHYKAMPLDDAMSGKIFDQYLKSLDPEKLFFIQADIDQLSSFRSRLGDAIMAEDLAVPFAIFNRYALRVSGRLAYARKLLKGGFDFRQMESYQYEREKAAWAKSETEIHELWRKRVKNDWLRLKLAGKDDQSIAETLDKRYEQTLKRISRIKSEDAFQTFMNAYTMAIDPHTNYMGPRAAEDFDISMRLSLVGIGAVLEEKDDYTTIRELVPGGPAALSGLLKIGDRILGVAQGQGGALTDIMGWRLDDTVALIRGRADSLVVLDILPADAGPDGKHQRVSLMRKKISLEEQAAKKSVLEVKDGGATRHIGVISLPTFYQDFDAKQKGDPNFKSASRDVARLLQELNKEKVDAVLVDLRNNGGGSLTEAVELTGLFVGKGPVVQQRNANGELSVESETHSGVAWSGPLGVLIDRSSASASEIFAAAIQDYGRGLLIGEPSFGKGTVQTMIDLDQVAKKPGFGELKFTVAQFFRINGGTTQLAGVKPDILLPTVSDPDTFGESSFDNALPWAQIKAANFAPLGDLKPLLPTLLSRHLARVAKDRDYLSLQEDIAEFKQLRKNNRISLNEDERRQERDAQEAKLSAREKLRNAEKAGGSADAGGKAAPEKPLRDDGLQANERSIAHELAAEKARKNAKDVLLDEAVHILSDEVTLAPGARIAAGAGPRLATASVAPPPGTLNLDVCNQERPCP